MEPAGAKNQSSGKMIAMVADNRNPDLWKQAGSEKAAREFDYFCQKVTIYDSYRL